MGGRGTGSGFRAEMREAEASRREEEAATAAVAAEARMTRSTRAPGPSTEKPGTSGPLDFTAREDHYRLASAAPRQVQQYMDIVRRVDYSAPRVRRGGTEITRVLNPDNSSRYVKTALRAVVIGIPNGRGGYERVYRQLHDKDGVVSEQEFRTMAAAMENGRRSILIEMRQRGIY